MCVCVSGEVCVCVWRDVCSEERCTVDSLSNVFERSLFSSDRRLTDIRSKLHPSA